MAASSTATTSPAQTWLPAARRPAVGVAFAIAGGLLFAVNGSVSKVALTAGMPTQRLTELRATGACLGLLLVLLVMGRSRLRITWREVPFLAGYGLTGVALVQWLYFVAISRLPVGVALLFEYTAPVFVALWARFVLLEQVRRRVWLALALSLGGLALVAQVWRGLVLDGLGVAAGLAAALALASYYLFGAHGLRTRDPLSLTFWAFLFGVGFLFLLPPWTPLDLASLGQPASLLGALDSLSVPLWVLVGWIALLGTLAPYALVLFALRHLPATRVGILGMVEPVAASAVAWVWLGQSLATVQMLGGFLVLIGVAAAQTAVTAPEDEAVAGPVPA